MSMHAALASGRVAAITDAASGIGLAAAKRLATMGLKLCLADLSPATLEAARAEVAGVSPLGEQGVIAVPTDVSRLEEVEKFRDAAYAAFGEVGLLMNNAGTAHEIQPMMRSDSAFAPTSSASIRVHLRQNSLFGCAFRHGRSGDPTTRQSASHEDGHPGGRTEPQRQA